MNTVTEKLYDTNPHLRIFQARVLECNLKNGRYEIILDRTAFYPEGGGQPSDTGVLNFANVLDVRESGGEILHTADRPLEKGTLVSGGINWPRRFALMQQHSGEHIVSGLAHRLFGLDNVGFHMGPQAITVDLNGELPGDSLALIEQMANEAVWQNIAVEVSYPSPEKLEAIPYRSKKKLTGQVRIVEIPGYDICACCGTHVVRTGEIGAVKLLSAQRYKGGTRLTMACGMQALADYREKQKSVSAVSVLFSAKPEEIGPAAERLSYEYSQLKREASDLRRQIFEIKAAELPAGCGNILRFWEHLSPDELRQLALILSERCGGTAAVFSGEEAKYRYAAADRVRDLRPLAKELSAALAGRGGGSKELVQGSVSVGRDAITDYFMKRSFR